MNIQSGKIEIISFVANIFLKNPLSSFSRVSRVRVAQMLVMLHDGFFHHCWSFSRFYLATVLLSFSLQLLIYPLMSFKILFFNIFEIVYLQQIRPLLKLDRDNYFKCFTWLHVKCKILSVLLDCPVRNATSNFL